LSSTDIRFGTDGWRGIIDEDFTDDNVRLVTRALVSYIREEQPAGHGLLVGYDNRRKSEDFARVAAEVVAEAGISVTLADRAISSPCLSFAVKHHGAQGGIMITASHNPPQFNGFKFKANYGGSGLPEIMAAIEQRIGKRAPNELQAEVAETVRVADITTEYLLHLASLVDLQKIKDAGWQVVTDAMHGSGAGYFPAILQGGETRDVPIREDRDLNFGGINPEPIAKNLGILFETVRQLGADAGLAVDGDADRIGAADEYGNFVDSHRIFAIILLHLVERRGWRGPVIKTISTTSMIDKLCAKLNLPLTVTPIGFKYITENMLERDILIGGEESGGIGIRHHLPERDGILLGLLLLEAMTLSGARLGGLVEEVFDIVGPHYYDRIDLHLSRTEMPAARERVVETQAQTVAGRAVERIDRMDGTKFYFINGSWLLLRASGTEPVVRVYAEAESPEAVQELLKSGEGLVTGKG